tara:strand:+ start:189 stop:530 length:342 start_codon:yes stop_codon:yes gene_type:complete
MKPEALQEKLNELNVLQQRLSIFTQQRQQLELSNAEITTSAEEVSKAKGKVYSLTGNVILEKDAKTLTKELETQKTKISKHLKTIGTQEEKLKNKALELQKEVTEGLQDDKSN